jgi:tetratricopeptide (TPR) repeat protein
MRNNNLTKILLCFLITLSAQNFAQLNLPRGSQMATVSQRIGITDVSIEYSRPSVNNREIWGKLVPYGMNNFGFGTAKESPWRAGANENTIIKFTSDAKVEGKEIKAGKYGFHIVVNKENTATLIFNKNYTAWGSYFYNPSDNVLQVDIQTKSIPHKEQLSFEFNEVTPTSALASLSWEKKQFPFKIEVDVPTVVMTDIRKKLENEPGFNRQTWEQAANYALNNGGDLNEALSWINGTISGTFYSQQTFNNTSIKAAILLKMGKQDEALAAMDSYMPKASILEVHQYGRQLLGQGLNEKALDVFKMNEKKNKNTWPVHYGLARGYSAKGEYKTALKHLKKALVNAPNAASKGRVEANIAKLEKGEDIN